MEGPIPRTRFCSPKAHVPNEPNPTIGQSPATTELTAQLAAVARLSIDTHAVTVRFASTPKDHVLTVHYGPGSKQSCDSQSGYEPKRAPPHRLSTRQFCIRQLNGAGTRAAQLAKKLRLHPLKGQMKAPPPAGTRQLAGDFPFLMARR
jgi:hypothetical protein